jgi:hypothetical protein
MAGEIEAYLRARKNFEQVVSEIDDLAFWIVEVGSLLRDDPSDIAFDNTGISLNVKVSRTIDANDWKSGRDIQELLASYHAAKHAMNVGWKNVPAEFREAIQPPFEEQD